ncbi:DUF2953 domain-containing protein [Paenibacillus puerhi]|uniref:DUF2953 domain-containing protein n=1 Tax=Paenibacillus puerhi TaxID=2692622 RepID=UPI00135A4647|nr:DUF2953 domain-containing protein [Paenibacillus puerhi]
MIGLGLIAAFLFVMGILLSRPVKVRLTFSHREENDEINVDIQALLGLVHFRYEVPVLRFKGWDTGVEVRTERVNAQAGDLLSGHQQNINGETIKNAYDQFRELVQHCIELNEWMKRLLRRVHCSELNWKTSVGLGDAPSTAILVGSLWAVKSSMLGYLLRMIQLEAQPQLIVTPSFHQKVFTTEGSGLFSIRIWYLLSGGVQLLRRIRKSEGGLETWKRLLTRQAPQPH